MEENKKPATVSRSVTKPAAANLKAPDTSLTVAKDLAKFITENKLSSDIQGKQYVQVEGWQFAGSRLGIVPIMGEVLNLSTDTEIIYQATVSLYDLHNKMQLGGGVAICSNKERSKKYYEQYAICSMAQTRAVGKAYRNVLAWIIRAAGFEATPLEEMIFQQEQAAEADAGTSAEIMDDYERSRFSVEGKGAAPGPNAAPQAEAPRPSQPAAAPVATPPATPTPAAPAAPAESGEPTMVVRASEADIKALLKLIANPLIDEEERTMMLSKSVDQRPATWVAGLLQTLPLRIAERSDPKKAKEAAQKQLRLAAAKYASAMGEQQYQNWMLRASSLTAKPEELRAEARQIQSYYQQAA